MLFRNLTESNKDEIVDAAADSAVWQEFPFHPLDSPGMPVAGENFQAHTASVVAVAEDVEEAVKLEAQRRGLSKLYLEAMYNGDNFCMPVKFKGQMETVRLIPGHFWGHNEFGPHVAAAVCTRPVVMLVGKMPSIGDLEGGRNFYGDAGQQLHSTATENGMSDAELCEWYLCNLVRWPPLLQQSGALPQAWVKDCAILLRQEMRILRPTYILCLGAEATKVVCGPKTTLQSMLGRSKEITFPVNRMDEEPATHTATVMAMMHPGNVIRNTDQHPQFESSLLNFIELVHGEKATKLSDNIRIRYVYKERELREIVDSIITQPGLKKIAVDAEWHGDHPGEPGAYMRTVQFSAADNDAVVVVLRYKGGGQAFMPGDEYAIRQLRRLLDRDDVQIIGHFFAADLPWLAHANLRLDHRFTVPTDLNAVRTGEYAGGFDTSLAAHSHNETAEYKLELLASRLLGADRWDIELHDWLKQYCTDNKMKVGDIEGFGECPEEILLPYGGKDAAYTRKLRDIYVGVPGNVKLPGLLNSDKYHNDCWLPFQLSMMAFRAFLEMHTVGINIDRQRIDTLTTIFEEAREELLASLRDAIDWPTFNPRSSQQCQELLFGEQYTSKQDKVTGESIRIRPEGAQCFELLPVKTTGNRSKPWGRVVMDGDEHKYSPSTDKETCGILAGQSHEVGMLRDVRLIDQVLKSVFRPPDRDKAGQVLLDDRGHRMYGGGIASFICHDGRIRSFFSQHKETGRASSSRPPLQNLSKRRERDYKRILGERYSSKIRSFIATNRNPSNGPLTVLVEADYQGAELFGMATQARDSVMIDHCLRSALPEDDPNHYDIHSNVAVGSFNLDCKPTKAGLLSIEREDLRVAAKNVIFGSGYGRSAEAISRQIREEGVDIHEHDAQKILDTIFELYTGILILQKGLRERAGDPGWVRSCFGRLRRCMPSRDRSVQGELERQFLNFPFQSMVADAVSIALHHLYTDPRRARLDYKIVLQIHDAIILEVPVEHLAEVYNDVLPDCMEAAVTFKACDFDGIPYPDSPDYRFSIDREVMLRWGENVTKLQCRELHISEDFGVQD